MNAVLKPVTTYQRESVRDVCAEVVPLLVAHWEEIAFYSDIPLDPDWVSYFNAEDQGYLRVYTSRRHGELIGYAAFFVRHNVHYQGSKQAAQDLIYVRPEYRKGRIGLGLIRYCEDQLRQEGCQLIMQHAKHDEKHVFGSLLERLGYDHMDDIWTKRLDR